MDIRLRHGQSESIFLKGSFAFRISPMSLLTGQKLGMVSTITGYLFGSRG
jgi:hypothetical protein